MKVFVAYSFADAWVPKHVFPCLVELAQVLGRWQRECTYLIKLLPDEFYKAVRPLLAAGQVICTCQVWDGQQESAEKQAPIRPIIGGLYITVDDLAPDGAVQVKVRAGPDVWYYDNVRQPSVYLRK